MPPLPANAPRPEKPADPADFVVVTGFTEVDGATRVWIEDRVKSKRSVLLTGDSFAVGNVKGTVQAFRGKGMSSSSLRAIVACFTPATTCTAVLKFLIRSQTSTRKAPIPRTPLPIETFSCRTPPISNLVFSTLWKMAEKKMNSSNSSSFPPFSFPENGDQPRKVGKPAYFKTRIRLILIGGTSGGMSSA